MNTFLPAAICAGMGAAGVGTDCCALAVETHMSVIAIAIGTMIRLMIRSMGSPVLPT
jgi:hypothetical protein